MYYNTQQMSEIFVTSKIDRTALTETLSQAPDVLEATTTLATEREWEENSVVPVKIQTLSRHEFCGNGFDNKLCYRGKFTDSPIEKQ